MLYWGMVVVTPGDNKLEEPRAATQARPREQALSPALLTRIFHQPSLVYFNAVAEYLSIREAARRLNVASSAITRQVAGLEDALGMALFQRESRRLKLTPGGEVLFRHSRRLMAPLEAAISELDMLRGLKSGTIRLAAAESVGLSFVPRLIAEFCQRYPRLHIDVSVTSSAEVIARVADERVDIGFGFVAGTPRGIEVAVQRQVRIGAVMLPGHALAARDEVFLEDCLDHHVAVAKPEISFREVIDPFLEQVALSRLPLVEVDSIRMLVELAQIGHHISIMTPIGAHNEIQRGELVFRPLADAGLPTNRFGLLLRAGGSLHFAPAVFYEHARRYFETVKLPGAV